MQACLQRGKKCGTRVLSSWRSHSGWLRRQCLSGWRPCKLSQSGGGTPVVVSRGRGNTPLGLSRGSALLLPKAMEGRGPGGRVNNQRRAWARGEGILQLMEGTRRALGERGTGSVGRHGHGARRRAAAAAASLIATVSGGPLEVWPDGRQAGGQAGCACRQRHEGWQGMKRPSLPYAVCAQGNDGAGGLMAHVDAWTWSSLRSSPRATTMQRNECYMPCPAQSCPACPALPCPAQPKCRHVCTVERPKPSPAPCGGPICTRRCHGID